MKKKGTKKGPFLPIFGSGDWALRTPGLFPFNDTLLLLFACHKMIKNVLKYAHLFALF